MYICDQTCTDMVDVYGQFAGTYNLGIRSFGMIYPALTVVLLRSPYGLPFSSYVNGQDMYCKEIYPLVS